MTWVIVACLIIISISLVVVISSYVSFLGICANQQNQEMLDKKIYYYVKAAEQIFRGGDRGLEKLNYVETSLEEDGVEITGQIRAMIASKVYEIGE